MQIALIATSQVNLGIRSLSSVLQAKGHEVHLYLLYSRNEYQEPMLIDLKNRLSNYEIIGLSCIAISWDKTVQIINSIKGLNVPVMIGGIHATLNPEICLQYADIVCVGEGEGAIVELADRMENNQAFYDVRNFHFRKEDGQIVKNPVRPLIQDLDSLPFIDYATQNDFVISESKLSKLTKLDLNTDHPSVEHRSSVFIYPTRGCPHRCIYCINRKLHELYDELPGKFVRKRSNDSIVAELALLKSSNPKLSYVYIMDDDFLVRSHSEIEDFANKYKARVGLPFFAYCTPLSVNSQKLESLIEAGLQTISMGIQSGSDATELEIYKRDMLQDRVLQAAKALNLLWKRHKKQLEPPVYDIMINNPLETEEDIIATVQLLRKIPKPFIASFHSLIVFPGTDLYFMYQEKGAIDQPYNGWKYHFHETIRHIQIWNKNIYLNSVLYWANWVINRWRWGLVPACFIPILISKPVRQIGKTWENLILFLDKLIMTRTRLFFLLSGRIGKRIWRKVFTKD